MSDALIDPALFVSSDITGNPISHPFVSYISELRNQVLVRVEIVCELIGIHLYEPKSSAFDKGRPDIPHFNPPII